MNKNLNENEQELLALRHTAEHALTLAMKRLYPGLMEAMGPATEQGFYFDFEMPDGQSVSIDDFPKIEAEIANIIKEDLPMVGKQIDAREAAKMFAGNPYKAEWAREIADRGEKAGIYDLGGQFADLCAGPHAKSTGNIGAVKLLSIAGAYWRGDSKNKMLTRIYGTAFKTKAELDEFLRLREEAEKRDHRKLGQQMKLFMFDPSAPGDAFWLHRGAKLWRNCVEFMRKRQEEAGYTEISTPQIMDKALWETSGHWSFYRENMFSTVIEERTFAVKPMNCPGGLII
ncbi:MAG: threonine--tRNA ligase, partial [Alphaproteobacteria bacterium]|nr:threonine--tRNA ligase [Alphaproteobacteria bacterium]